jgi:hypothetical protein
MLCVKRTILRCGNTMPSLQIGLPLSGGKLYMADARAAFDELGCGKHKFECVGEEALM